MIRHSASTVNRSNPPPGNTKNGARPGGDCFCLRYLLSDESWRITLTQKTMEMDFCVVFCAMTNMTWATRACVQCWRNYEYVMLRQCLENIIGEGLLHACISSILYNKTLIYWDLGKAVCSVAPRPPLLPSASPRATTAVLGPQSTLFPSVSVNKW
jgi:hypothetical protein